MTADNSQSEMARYSLSYMYWVVDEMDVLSVMIYVFDGLMLYTPSLNRNGK